jgi:hypothetical protein
MTSPNVAIRRMLPKYLEIMNRLILGQKETEIARDLGLSSTRVNQIVNSPLFQLELKRQLRKRFNRILNIEETIIDASESGAKLFKDVLSNPNIALPIRLEAGNKALTHLFGRVLKQMPEIQGESKGEDDLPYEKRLEREIRIKETTFYPSSSHLSPPDSHSEQEGQNGDRPFVDSDLPPTFLDAIAKEEREVEEEWVSDVDDDLFPSSLKPYVEKEEKEFEAKLTNPSLTATFDKDERDDKNDGKKKKRGRKKTK